ncbi:hypothetical protein BPMI_03507c [Candidatus Burkholderia pumila]|uniref:EpsG family protein n=1 Tax=Candidatus Burkholderia pumila TaxID=1090375 RepID=A0ABR5HM28_9BURK|nr:hypothetical protein BPMI_03507c [Candidatus Burkholderia pumila]
MTPYLAVFIALWGAFFISSVLGEIEIPLEVFAITLFVVFAGQRFETGNDWLTYRDHFIAIQQFGFSGGDSPQFPAFEPLYILTVWLFGRVFDFQAFLLFVSVFNGLVLYRFAKTWNVSVCGLAAINYSWTYLATQMATTRYSLAMSFILLAFIFLIQHRKFVAYALVIVAAGFHFFSLAFLPVVLLINRKLTVRLAASVLIAGFLIVHVTLFAVSSGWFNGLPFSEKLVFYLDEATVKQISAGSVGYIVLNLAFLVWVLCSQEDDDKMRLVKWSVFYLLFFQIVAWMLPVFWNRIQVFTVVVQACLLSRYMVERCDPVFLLTIAVLSFATLMKLLVDPAFISYVPYQSYWVNKVMMNAVRDDGESRFYQAIDRNRERAH